MFFCLCLIAASDILLQKLVGTKARWFQLHAFINLLITISSFQDLMFVIEDPLTAITKYCDRGVSILVLSLHLYHVIAFKKLTNMDIMHHSVSVLGLGIPGALLYHNKLLNACNFFICGLPGLISYACLTAVKNGKMKKITEKKITALINVYFRQPGILYTSILNYIAYRYRFDTHTPPPVFIIMSLLSFLNANFFSYEAIYNYGFNEGYTIRP
jgi:hypothetical protein